MTTAAEITQDRYAIVSRDWQRFEHRYVVVDTHEGHAPVFQTNDFATVIRTRNDMNAEVPPPCERGCRPGFQHEHPRFPSGDCMICAALAHEGCKHALAVGEYAPREG